MTEEKKVEMTEVEKKAMEDKFTKFNEELSVLCKKYGVTLKAEIPEPAIKIYPVK